MRTWNARFRIGIAYLVLCKRRTSFYRGDDGAVGALNGGCYKTFQRLSKLTYGTIKIVA
jgi:hypothetical protein